MRTEKVLEALLEYSDKPLILEFDGIAYSIFDLEIEEKGKFPILFLKANKDITTEDVNVLLKLHRKS